MNIYDNVIFVSTANKEMPYAQFVDTLFKHDTDDMEMMHSALGITGEAGEIADAVKKAVIYCEEIDRANIVEELGDLRFYMQALMNKLGIRDDEVLQHNANKLAKRYPKGEYSNQDAIARADKSEAQIRLDRNESLGLPNTPEEIMAARKDAEDDSDGSRNQ